MAAIIALSLGSFVYWIQNREHASSLQIYEKYYQPYPAFINIRNASLLTITDQATRLYNSEKYEEALPLLIQIIKMEPDNVSVQFAAGIAQLETGQIEKATQTFSAIKDPEFKEIAQWYLALTFVKQKDYENARTVLELIEKESYNYSKAQEILQIL